MAATEPKSPISFQKIKDSVQFFLVIFGASWGIYTFIYKDVIVPARRPPAITLNVTLEELDRADGMILVRAHLVVANRGDAKVWVPSLYWNVYGVSFSGEERTPADYAKGVRPLLTRGDEGVSRFSSTRLLEAVASMRIPSYEWWYQPKDETVHEQLFLVPEGRFDALQIYVGADIFKDILEFAPTRWDISDEGELTPTLLLKDSGWEKDATRVVPFEPESNIVHRKMLDKEDAGHNDTTASLRLKPKPLTAKPTVKSAK